jgi:hypothetical protein
MMLLEEAPGSMRPVRAQEPHFKVSLQGTAAELSFEKFFASLLARASSVSIKIDNCD